MSAYLMFRVEVAAFHSGFEVSEAEIEAAVERGVDLPALQRSLKFSRSRPL